MTSSNGNIFRVTGPLCGEFTGHRWNPLTLKGQWRGAVIYSLICAWTTGWVNNRDAVDLRRHRAHSDVTVMPQAAMSPRCAFVLYANVCLRCGQTHVVCQAVCRLFPLESLYTRYLDHRNAGTSLIHVRGTCAKYQKPTCSPKIARYINGRVAFPQSIPGIVWRVQRVVTAGAVFTNSG